MRSSLKYALVALLILATPIVWFRVSTVRAVSRIEALQGRTGDFSEITRSIRTHYSHVNSVEDLERARLRMGLQTTSNLFVVRYNGEGLPYFYGFVAYDTNRQQIVKAVVDQLW